MNGPPPDLEKAIALFRSFQNRSPRPGEIVEVGGLVRPACALEVGTLISVGYKALGDGKDYYHEFEGRRPRLYVTADGRQFYGIGGEYRFTVAALFGKGFFNAGQSDDFESARRQAQSRPQDQAPPQDDGEAAAIFRAAQIAQGGGAFQEKAQGKNRCHRSNPKRRSAVAKKRRRHRGRKARRFHSNPRRRFRRNPIEGSASSFLSGTMLPAAVGAAGAIGVDLLIGNLPLSANLKSGTMLP